MKLNELVCPSCGLKCLVDTAYTACDACGAHFTAAQSRSRDVPAPYPTPGTITWPQITWPGPLRPPYTVGDPPPGTQPLIGDPIPGTQPIWIAPYGPPGTPYGPTVICEAQVEATIKADTGYVVQN